MRIKFQDGGDDDFALLRKFNPIPIGPTERSESVDDCIYNGFLSKEEDVHVTVTGCAMSDNYQVIFFSVFQLESFYLWNLITGFSKSVLHF